MKRFLFFLACLFVGLRLSAQQREKYEFSRNLPVYADSLIADLTYPLAWGNSEITDFDAWKKAARQKVFDCMLMPPPPPPHGYDVKVLCEEQRDGYRAQKLEIRLSRYYTVPAYLLIPDGKGPFPAVNVLHDHGAHLFIGKEKVIRPLACEDSVVIKDAEAWLAGYEGQFFGDYLAQNGYVVFAADAPMWGERGQQEGPRRDRYDMIAGNMMMYGIDLSAWMTYDDIAGTEFLASMPEVDASRIGCTGWSMGLDALGTLRPYQGGGCRVLDGHHRRTAVVQIQPHGEWWFRQLYPGFAPLARLSPCGQHRLSETHAVHQRFAG